MIKTNLFRFMTLRSPELLPKERREIGFTDNPAPEDSKFLSAISGIEDVKAIQKKLADVVKKFKPYKSVEEVKSISPDLWEFSMWISKNHNTLTKAMVDSKTLPAIPSKSARKQIWDNLYFDIVQKQNPYVRQALLQLIVAINFIDKFKTTAIDDESVLRRLANGKVIIPNVFRAIKKDRTGSPQPNNTRVSNDKRLVQSLNSYLAKDEIDNLNALKEEFIQLEKDYRNDRKVSFDKAYNKYSSDVDKKIKIFIKANPLEVVEGGRRIIIDSNDGALNHESKIPYDLIDDFSFEFEKPLSPKYTKGKLSEIAANFIINEGLEEASVKDAISSIEAQISQNQKSASKVLRKQARKMLINGVETSAKSTVKSTNFAMCISPIKQRDTRMYFSFAPGTNTDLFNADLSLKIGTKTYQIQTIIQTQSNNGALLASFQITDLTQNTLASSLSKTFVFSGQITTTDNRTFVVNARGIVRSLVDKDRPFQGELNEILDDTVVENPHYGINKIGVADFRRVEQELCCYIPGEVSHVENILAREYKEKSTRNLISSERIVESTTEQEIEEVNDTVSTSRHEMSAEIAKVVDRDSSQNIGFSTSYGGGKLPYHVGLHGDFAFSQSSSVSNSTARNYAEDVTKRALERIVQKTTVKRTSRILKEYEENNRHGFDNRDGTKHVTGVYRWIDKVYKNRLVNYGKRLMYEFVVPEPARGYKELIIAEIDEDNNGGNTPDTQGTEIGKPEAPDLDGPTDINRNNYAGIAANYGADVNAPMDENNNVTASYSESIGTTDQEKSFPYNDLRVAQDYQCYKITGDINFRYLAHIGPKAFIRTSIAGKNWSSIQYRGSGIESIPLEDTVNNIEGAIPITVNSKKMTSFTLSVEAKCKLKDSVYSQWQQDTYDAIMDGYNAQLQAYNDAIEQAEAEAEIEQAQQEEDKASNSGFNSSIIITELKRLCIEMLMAPFGLKQGADFYEDSSCDVPKIILNEQLDIYASRAKFFEQAFDWQLMAHIFYPYYWAKCDTWKELFQLQEGNDHNFRAFLQSGLCRLVVPVREGFEDAVVFYMETGEVWNGTGIVIDTDDELYLSIVDEMTQIAGEVEDEWETVVPSTLTIVQARSALLNEGGLPCCETDAEVLADLNIKEDLNILELLKE